MKRLYYFILTIICFTGSIGNVQACKCGSTYDFMQWFRSFWRDRGLVIAKAIVGAPIDSSRTQLLVLHHYYGSPRDTIVCSGSGGNDCFPNLNKHYQQGDTIIVGLESGDPTNPLADYFLTYCSTTHLQVKRDSVFGGFETDFTFKGFPLLRFEDSLQRIIDSLPTPTGIVTLNHPAGSLTHLYPNPANSRLYIDYDEPGSIMLYSIDGRILQKMELTNDKQQKEIPIGNIPQGICLYRYISSSGKTECGKVLISGR